MQSFKQPGDVLTLTAPVGGVTVDTPVLIGNLLVIPTSSARATERFEGKRSGVFRGMPKTAGVAWTQGVPLYWDDSGEKFTTIAAGNYGPVGAAAAAADSNDTTGEVVLERVIALQQDT